MIGRSVGEWRRIGASALFFLTCAVGTRAMVGTEGIATISGIMRVTQTFGGVRRML